MSGPKEETYSTIFTSLRHAARRKILRMLSEKPRNFSEMLEQLGISSSHLTYHLESLGDLVTKMDDGRYRLSTFGEAAVATMSTVEELKGHQKPESRHLLSPPKKVSTSWVVLMIGIVTLASICVIQYQFLNQLSAEHEQLKAKYEMIVEGQSPEPWERTPENIAKLKEVEQQAIPDLERLKDEGVPIYGVYVGVDEAGKWVELFVLLRHISPENKVKLMDVFGWDVPVAFHRMGMEEWPDLSKAQLYTIFSIDP